MTVIFAGDETSTGHEGREGGASFAKGEADANPPRCSLPPVAAKSAAAAKAPGEKAAGENAAAAAEKAATAEPPPEAFGRLGGEPVGARADWPHLLTFCRHID